MSRLTKRLLQALAGSVALALVAILAWSFMTRVAEPAYVVQTQDGDFEVRAYAPRVVAETVVVGERAGSDNEGFRRLAAYLFGKNQTQAKIAMTAPVGQRPESRKLAMTAPVGQRSSDAGWVVSFTMPEGETLETLPRPVDDRVVLRALPASRVAVVRFGGRWRDETFRERTAALVAWATARGLSLSGEPEINRYDPPWTLWFLRRNEVWFAVSEAGPRPS